MKENGRLRKFKRRGNCAGKGAMMNIICQMKGHQFPRDSEWGKPYLRINGSVIDGIGRIHAHLFAECARCGKQYHVANVHLPKEKQKGPRP